MRIENKLLLSVAVVGMFYTSPLYAQFFSDNVSAQRSEEQAQQRAVAAGNQYQQRTGMASQQGMAVPQNQQYLQQQAAQQQLAAQQMQQQAARQRQQQAQQATSTFAYGNNNSAAANAPRRNAITFSNNNKKKDQELIMMYMKDFNIYRSPSGQTRCSMQFAIVTTLPTKVSNISYRLKWPAMETVLSFSDIQPQVENHFNYSLLGDGCYSMDKSPNIIINRCRVKGMSQRTCAGKVRWITRAS